MAKLTKINNSFTNTCLPKLQLSETSQTQKGKHCMIAYQWNLRNPNSETVKIVVSKGRGVGTEGVTGEMMFKGTQLYS